MLTNVDQHSLLKKEVFQNLRDNKCPFCKNELNSNSYSCLVGRARQFSSSLSYRFIGTRSGLPEEITTTNYAYQGCHLPICKICVGKYKVFERVNNFLYIIFGVLFLGLVFVALLKIKIPLPNSILTPLWVVVLASPFAAYLISEIFMTSERYSRGIVETNKDFPILGVPTKSNQTIIKSYPVKE